MREFLRHVERLLRVFDSDLVVGHDQQRKEELRELVF
jgi:hypothetical protein